MKLYVIILTIFSLFFLQNFVEEIRVVSDYVGDFIFKSLGLENLVGNFFKNLDVAIKTTIYVVLIIFAIVLALLILKNFIHLIILVIILLVLIYILFNYF